jgi:hydrogenase maturation protease
MDEKVLVIGYGNPGRRDDGIGPAIADAIEGERFDNVRTQTGFQLNLEDAAALAETDAVVFVDAAKTGAEPFEFREVQPAREFAFTTHHLDPGSVVALCRDVYQHLPRAYALAVRGYEFEFAEGFSEGGRSNLDRAVGYLKQFIAAGAKTTDN